MKIVSDANIPFVEKVFSRFGKLHLIPGHEINPETIRTADAILVRSVTSIDSALLEGSAVQFIGSATAEIGRAHV